MQLLTEHIASRFDSRRLIENREMRFFLSSTFADMDAERSELVKTFETLKEEASRRNVTMSLIDLRWGVTDEEARSGKVLSVCLNEIEYSHPFFIGLLGHHYGTSPDISVLKKDPTLEERYPWIRKDIEDGLSITEIEMQYGVLRNPNEVEALFFLKDTLDSTPDDNEKLSRLKNQIREQNRFAKNNYSSIEDLCAKANLAIRSILDKYFPVEEFNRLDQERTAQKAYMNSRHGFYQRVQADFDRLDTFLANDETHLVITGASGMGKSALLANWLKEKEEEHLPFNIIYHFVGNSFSGSDYNEVLQHICDEIYDIYELEHRDGLNESLEDEAQRILVEAGQKGKRLLIVIDGINQIDDYDYSKLLNWLPQAPQTTKYLFSTLDGDETMETFKRRGYSIHSIKKLKKSQRKAFITHYLGNVGKYLTEKQIGRIISDSENENMMVLKTLLDELICFGSHQMLDSHIDYYLQASSTDDFFDRMLRRMERDYEQVPRILSLVAISENGLSENDLEGITAMRPLDIHLFYCAFRNHFIVRNGLLTFSHQHIRDAVSKRYHLDEVEATLPYRQQIIDFICNHENIPSDWKITESAFQYYYAGNDEQLYKTILSLEAFRLFNSSDNGDILLAEYWHKLLDSPTNKYDLSSYLNLSCNGIEINDLPYLEIGQFIHTYIGDTDIALKYCLYYLKLLGRVQERENLTLAALYNNLGVLYCDNTNYDKALEYHNKALSINIQLLGTDHLDTATSYNNIGTVYDDLGEFDRALEYYHKALAIEEKVLGQELLNIANTYNNVGGAYLHKGEYNKALEYYDKSLKINEKIIGTDSPFIATSYCNIGTAYDYMGQYETALEYNLKSLKITEQFFGHSHPETATSYNNIGAIYHNLGYYGKSLECYDKALTIRTKKLNKGNPSIAQSYNNIGMVHDSMGNYILAKSYFFKALSITKKAFGPNHYLIAECEGNIGGVYYHLGKYNKALQHYSIGLEICRQELGEYHPCTASSYSNIGVVYSCQEDYDKALEYYFKSFAIRYYSLGLMHPDTAISIDHIGTAYHEDEKYHKALEYLHKALEIRISSLGENHIDTSASYNNIGSVFDSIEEYQKALDFFFKALNIKKTVLGVHHPETAITTDNIGGVYDSLKKYDEALKYYSTSLEIREKELGKSHPDTALSYNNIGFTYCNLEQYDEALRYYRKALNTFKKAFGIDNPNTAFSFSNIAGVYQGQKKYKQALKYSEKALEILKKTLPPKHPDVILVRENIKAIEKATKQDE